MSYFGNWNGNYFSSWFSHLIKPVAEFLTEIILYARNAIFTTFGKKILTLKTEPRTINVFSKGKKEQFIIFGRNIIQ